MDDNNKIKPLIILDKSGSMNEKLNGNTRFDNCKKIIENFDFFDLWLFDVNIKKLNNLKKFDGVKCENGTDIPKMLRGLCEYLNEVKPKSTYIILLTDDQCEYDPNEFAYDFKILDNNYYIVYDICGTNMEKLNTVFGDQADITNDINGINKLIDNLKEFVVKDQKLLEKIMQTDESLNFLKNDIKDLNNLINDLEEKRNQINKDMYSNLTINFGTLFNFMSNINNYTKEIRDLIENHEKIKKNKITKIKNKVNDLENDIKEAKDELETFEKSKKFTNERKNYFNNKIINMNKELEINKDELKNIENKNNYNIKNLKTDGNIINILGKLIKSFFGW